MNWLKFIIVLTMLFSSLNAQLQTYASFNEAYESNPFRNPDAKESWVSTIDGGIQLDFQPMALSYNGSYTNFSNFSDRSYYWHQAAFIGSFGNTNTGVYFNQRFNRNDYTLYNYNSFIGYLNHSEKIGTFNLYLATTLVLNDYPELAEINNYELNGSMRINKSFQTGTTFIAGLSLHYKKYTTTYSYLDTVLTGSGSGQGMYSGSQTILQPVEIDAPSVSQMGYWLRIAQSLSQSTGLAAQVRARNNIKGATRYIAGLPYNYNEESELFDDPMGYELQSLGIELTQLLPDQIIFKASTYLGIKSYTAQGIYLDQEIFEEGILREDNYHSAHMSLRKNFSIHKTRLTIEFWYRWMTNKSNSYWYNYDNHYGSISLSLNI